MAQAHKIQETRHRGGVQTVYRLDQPVRDVEGDETLFVALSAMLEAPDTGKPQTIIVCVFPCPQHGSHMGRFAPELEAQLTIEKYSHAEVLDRLGYTIVDELANLD